MSLHTKYRPHDLDQLIGQDHIVASLRQVVKDRRAKSFLFTGPSGCGKTTTARILADLFVGGKATVANMEEIDAATSSGADNMRAVIARSNYRAVGHSPVKSIIVDEAHRLSAAAWTVLLKPIEEPPAHVFWLLCTTEPGKVPKTIITRCLRYDLKPVSEELIYELLQDTAGRESLGTSDAVLEAIAEAAMGSPRQAMVFLEVCASCKSAAEAQIVMHSAAQSKDVVDLARFLLNGRPRTWAEAMKYAKALNGAEAESTRIALINYFGAVLASTQGDSKAVQVLGLMECFATAYNASDRMAPLLRSIGLALNMDQ